MRLLRDARLGVTGGRARGGCRQYVAVRLDQCFGQWPLQRLAQQLVELDRIDDCLGAEVIVVEGVRFLRPRRDFAYILDQVTLEDLLKSDGPAVQKLRMGLPPLAPVLLPERHGGRSLQVVRE